MIIRYFNPVFFYISLSLVDTDANLEGPFLFWGPSILREYQRPALKALDQDDLMRIYESQAAIVVFNNQDSVPLSSANFPRLRKMLEGQSTLVLPQDFLDVHPDYISNETQMLTLQGPWSERDAQITETFQRLQDIYGTCRVLGILGNSVSQELAAQYAEIWRVRRQAKDNATEEGSEPSEKLNTRALLKYALYNASSTAEKGVLLYSSGWPVLKWDDGTVVVLNNPVGEQTIGVTKIYEYILIKFLLDNTTSSTSRMIQVEIHFKWSADGWWSAVGALVSRERDKKDALPVAGEPPTAPVGSSYHCSQPLIFTDGNISLTFDDIQVQLFMNNKKMDRFGDILDCVGFTTAPIWSGLFVSSLIVLGVAVSISVITDIKTNDRFESNRNRQLTVTVND